MTTPSSSGIRLETDGHIARATLDRPDQHNALDADAVGEMRAFLREIESNPHIRVLVLTGTGARTFCSGASLVQMETGEMSGDIFDKLTGMLAAVRVPTVCGLNGDVYGGGAELALCCDFRIAVRGIRLSVPAARLGVCYPVGGLTRYVERLGITTAMRILLAAEDMDTDTLLEIGYLSSVVERKALTGAVGALADRLAALAPLAVQTMKRLLLDAAAGSLDPAEAERLIAACRRSPDAREGLAAWRERREPDFSG